MANQAPTTKDKATRNEFVEAIMRIAIAHGPGRGKDVVRSFGFFRAAEEMTQARCDEVMEELREIHPECFPEMPEQRPKKAEEPRSSSPEFERLCDRITDLYGTDVRRSLVQAVGLKAASGPLTIRGEIRAVALAQSLVDTYAELKNHFTNLAHRNLSNDVVTGPYAELQRVLDQAFYSQTQGKAKSRHNKTGLLPFEQQRIMTISETIRSPHGLTYQITKKMLEALEMDEVEKTIHELQGVVVYVGALILYVERQELRRRALAATPTPTED